MPYQVIGHPDEKITRSLGKLAYWFIRNFVIYGPGSVSGQPVRLGPERVSELLRMYALSDKGRRLYSSVFMSKCKGFDKSGFAGYIGCFEAVGPARFAGWAEGGEKFRFLGRTYTYEPGEPMGRPVSMPVIRCIATESDQSGNIYDNILDNFQEGPLSELGLAAFDGYIDLGNGGKVLPSTTGAASKDGGKETLVLADETHLWTVPRLKSAYAVLKRNLTKRPTEEPWLLETTTMYEPGAQSVAEETYTYAKAIQEGKARRPNLLFLHRYGLIEESELEDEAKLRVALTEAMGEAAEWLSVDDRVTEIYDPRTDVRDSIRYFLNALAGAATAWLTPAQLEKVTVDEQLEPGDEIALGFDGSLTGDSTALVAVRLRDNLVQLLHLQESPTGAGALMWSVDKGAVDHSVARAFDDFEVKAFFCDPPYWQDEVAAWTKEYGEKLAPARPSAPLSFWTSNESQMVNAIERFKTLVLSQGLKLSRNPALIRHFNNARVGKKRLGDLIYKEMRTSPKKIDVAVASVIALAAASAARGFTPKKSSRKDPNAGIVSSVPLDVLIPRFGGSYART